jgi:hypothetical protein
MQAQFFDGKPQKPDASWRELASRLVCSRLSCPSLPPWGELRSCSVIASSCKSRSHKTDSESSALRGLNLGGE